MPMPSDASGTTGAAATIETPKNESEQKILQQLTHVQQTVDQNGHLTRLLTHPGVREVLAMEAAGKQYKVVDAAAEPPVSQKPQDPFEGVDFENTDIKTLATKLLGATEQIADQRAQRYAQEQIQKTVGPLQQQIEQLRQFAGNETQLRTVNEIKAVSEKYANFEDLRPQMINISKKYPGMPVEEMYQLAAVTTGKGVKLQASADSERETGSAQLPSLRDIRQGGNKGKEFPRNQKGFEEMLDLALGRQDITRFPSR